MQSAKVKIGFPYMVIKAISCLSFFNLHFALDVFKNPGPDPMCTGFGPMLMFQLPYADDSFFPKSRTRAGLRLIRLRLINVKIFVHEDV